MIDNDNVAGIEILLIENGFDNNSIYDIKIEDDTADKITLSRNYFSAAMENIFGGYTLSGAHTFSSSMCDTVTAFPCRCLFNKYTYNQ